MFEVGDVVVCVSTQKVPYACQICGCMPSVTKGTYYRITDVEPHYILPLHGLAVKVQGIKHWWFPEHLFRKIERSSEDIFKLAKKSVPKELELV
jgi:hypothetical protein